MSIFLAFAAMYPDMQVMLYFIIPIKMKWMAWVYLAFIGYDLIRTFASIHAVLGTAMAWWVTIIMLVTILLSLLNFLIFYLSTKNLQRYTPHEVHRRRAYRASTGESRRGAKKEREEEHEKKTGRDLTSDYGMFYRLRGMWTEDRAGSGNDRSGDPGNRNRCGIKTETEAVEMPEEMTEETAGTENSGRNGNNGKYGGSGKSGGGGDRRD